MPHPHIVSETFGHSGGILVIEEHAVKITIPDGAIETDCRVQVKAAASLFGPYSIPESYLPISAFVWIGACYQFLKPLEVEIEHFALITQLQDLSNLCVLTDDKESLLDGQEYKMQEDTCQFQYKINETTCTLFSDRFCSKCLAAKYRNIPKRVMMYHYLPEDYKLAVEFVAEVCFCYDLTFCKKVCT